MGLRKPDSRSMSVSMSIRRSQPGKGWLTKGLADPLSLNANVTTGRALTELSEARSTLYAFNANYQLLLRRKGIRLPFGGIAKAASISAAAVVSPAPVGLTLGSCPVRAPAV